ncbi:MAG: hypothetical protein IH810_04290, partial [Proteobacteria bacterium]|nr:hypothetical protein [Pseudomonadota bacterium]
IAGVNNNPINSNESKHEIRTYRLDGGQLAADPSMSIEYSNTVNSVSVMLDKDEKIFYLAVGGKQASRSIAPSE